MSQPTIEERSRGMHTPEVNTNNPITVSTSPSATVPRVTCCPLPGRAYRIWADFLEFATFEFILTRCRLANGSGVIVLRSILTALVIYLLALGLQNLLDSTRSWEFSLIELKTQVRGTMQWYGAIFAVIYAGLYSRFASQWAYLANVYNQIKAVECREHCNPDRLSEWKAGFIEDAEELHLAGKPLFASILRVWGQDAKVREYFVGFASGGDARFEALMERVEAVWQHSVKVR